MKLKSRLVKNEVLFEEWLLVAVIMLLGGFLRLSPVLNADFPLNDGGLFYVQIKDLQANGFHIPLYTSYNGGEIPFTYPPLGFYLVGWINTVFQIDHFEIMRFLPVTFSILTIPAFFLLAKEILKTRFQYLHATYFFSMMLGVIEWQISGGGLARSPAYFFSVLSLFTSAKVFKGNNGFLIPSGILIALTGYFHPEIFWSSVLFIIVMAVFLSTDIRSGIQRLVMLGMISLVCISPYFASVVIHHGVQPFTAALGSGEFNLAASILFLLFSNLTKEISFTAVLLMASLAFFYNMRKKEYLLPALVIASVLLDLRSIQRTIAIPLVMLGAIGLEKILAVFVEKEDEGESWNKTALFPNKLSAVVTLFILMRLLFGTFTNSQVDTVFFPIDSEHRQAMAWVGENIEPESEFVVLVPSALWATNKELEWFPALTGSRSLLTAQGTEWLPDDRFYEQVITYNEVLEAASEGDGLAELERVLESHRIQYSHIYLSGDVELAALNCELSRSFRYAPIFENANVFIYERVQP